VTAGWKGGTGGMGCMVGDSRMGGRGGPGGIDGTGFGGIGGMGIGVDAEGLRWSLSVIRHEL